MQNYWIVRQGNQICLCVGEDRETAKNNAYRVLGGDKDLYICSVIADKTDRLWINIPVQL